MRHVGNNARMTILFFGEDYMNPSIKFAAGFVALAIAFAAPVAHANENAVSSKSAPAAKSATVNAAAKSTNTASPSTYESNGSDAVTATSDETATSTTAATPSATETKKSATAEKAAAKKQTVAAAKSNAVSANNDIVANLAASSNFKTLSNLIQAAGLADTLKGSGPFTVFAPTDAAFAKLPAGTIEDLMKPQNKASLRSILTFHVVPGKLTNADLLGKQLSQNTVEGSSLSINNSQGAITVGSAKISGSEIASSNGTVFTIDAVQLPASYQPKSM